MSDFLSMKPTGVFGWRRLMFDFIAVQNERHGARRIQHSIRRFWRTAGRLVGHRMNDVGDFASGRMLQVVDLTR